MALRNIFLTICTILLFIVDQCQPSRLALSHITLLLPYSSDLNTPSQFKINSHGGSSQNCVEWSVEPRTGVIDIIPQQRPHTAKCPPGTHNEAIIKAVADKSAGRVSATITARDPRSRHTAECEVFVDRVATLQVATSTRLIYLGKYESLTVK